MKGLLLSSVFVGVLVLTGASAQEEPSQSSKPAGPEGAFGGITEGDNGPESSEGAGGVEEGNGLNRENPEDGENQGSSQYPGGAEEAEGSNHAGEGSPAEGNENHESGDDQGSSEHPGGVEETEHSRFSVAGEADHPSEGSYGAGNGRGDYGERPGDLEGARGGRREGYGAHYTHNGHHLWNNFHMPSDWLV